MFYKYRKTILAMGFALLAFSVGGLAKAQAAEPRKKIKKHPSSRSIASLGVEPLRVMGQGESMLYRVKSTRPGFLASRESPSLVKIAGVCRDAYGMTYNSMEKGYGDCLDARGSGSVVDSTQIQRQAGVGILVGH